MTTTAESKEQSRHWRELYLTVTEGQHKGERFALVDGENILGRAGTVRFEGEGVSRQHSRINVGEELEIEDLGSTSGTMLNSRMLVGKDYVFDGDEIRIGTAAFRLTAKRRENRAGAVGAMIAILVAAVLLAAGLFFQDYLTTLWRQRNARKQLQESVVRLPSWLDWNNAELPSEANLREEKIPISTESAMIEFNFGMQLYDDRMLDPGNAHQAVIHFKRALGIASCLPVEARPAIMNRSVMYMREMQQSIMDNCNTKVFAFVRNQQMRYWSGCYEALNLIVRYVPNPNDPYHLWARQQINRLDMIFKK